MSYRPAGGWWRAHPERRSTARVGRGHRGLGSRYRPLGLKSVTTICCSAVMPLGEKTGVSGGWLRKQADARPSRSVRKAGGDTRRRPAAGRTGHKRNNCPTSHVRSAVRRLAARGVRRASRVRIGIARNSASVYGCSGERQARPTVQLDDAAEIHHGDTARDALHHAEVVRIKYSVPKRS